MMDIQQKIKSLEGCKIDIHTSMRRIYNMISNLPTVDACTYHLIHALINIGDVIDELKKEAANARTKRE